MAQSNFAALASKLAAQGIKNPGGLAYTIGARKFGKKTMGQAAARGVSAASVAKGRK